jgi:hypothetical protein
VTLAWNLVWVAKFPDANIADPDADDDGDGVSTYQEMLAGTDPGAGPERPAIVSLPGTPIDSPTLEDVSKNLRQLAEVSRAAETKRESEVLERAAKFDIGVVRAPDGRVVHPYAISEDGSVFRGTPLDVIAADTIGADELWPAPLWQIGGPTLPNFVHGSTGLNLTGSGQILAMWEDWEDAEFTGTVGGIDVNHPLLMGITPQGLVPRMTQGEEDTNFDFVMDSPDVPDSDHACAVASMMAGIGLDSMSGNFNAGQQARGIAFNSIVIAYERNNYVTEFINLADPLSPIGIDIANNSRGVASGWLPNPAGGWKWFGEAGTSAVEDWRFGAYAGNLQGYDYFPQNLDTLSTSTPYTLQLFGAGNFRNVGPGSAGAAGTYLLGDGPATSTATRDWINGDDGGYDSLPPSAVAKNVLTVGSCTDVANGHLPTSPEPVYSSFSSAGPTDDGRIKPEIVAPGEILVSSRAPGGSTTAGVAATLQFGLNGTSFSAPVVSGGLALVLERRAQLQPVWTAPSFPWQLQSSTLRMLVVQTARDLGAPGPDFRGGYGMFNAFAAVEAMSLDASTGTQAGNNGYKPLIKEMLFSNNSSAQFEVKAVGPGQPLKITVAWTDPAGFGQTSGAVDQTMKRLRNDFDLRIYPPGSTPAQINDPNSTVAIKPWVLDPDLPMKSATARAAAALRGDDNTNNLEQVVVDSPVADGIYTVRVTHKGNLFNSSSQWVSLGISGRVVPTSHNFQITEFRPVGGGNFVVSWNAIPGGIYSVEGSPDFSYWSQLSGQLSARSDSMSFTVTPPPGASSYFIRVGRSY